MTRGERPPGSLHQGGFFKELQKEQKCKISSVQLFDHRGLTENEHSCFLDRQTKRCMVSGQTRKQSVLDHPHTGEVTQPYYRSNGCHKLKKLKVIALYPDLAPAPESQLLVNNCLPLLSCCQLWRTQGWPALSVVISAKFLSLVAIQLSLFILSFLSLFLLF